MVVARSILLGAIAVFGFWWAPSCYGQDRGPILAHVTREIYDAATGTRWLLLRDASDPGGPGRMVLIASADEGSREVAGSESKRTSVPHAANPIASPAIDRVIHAGDALVVEEHSLLVDARLEAVALGSAVVGSEFEARLKIGGKTVHVMALGPGRAALMPERKAQP